MVAKFEQEIGIQIFDRKTKPVSITFEGESIISFLEVILKDIDNLNHHVSYLKGEYQGNFKIAVIPTISGYLFPLIIDEFIKKFPSIQIEISELTTEKIIEKLEDRTLDVGILSLPINNELFLEYPIYTEQFVLYDMQKDNKNGKIKIDDIKTSNIWLLEEGHCLRNQFINLCDLDTINCGGYKNLEYKAGSLETLIKMVKTNRGSTLLPYLAKYDLSETDQSRINLFEEPVPVRKIGCVVHRHFSKNTILSKLIKIIEKKVSPLLGNIPEQLLELPPNNVFDKN